MIEESIRLFQRIDKPSVRSVLRRFWERFTRLAGRRTTVFLRSVVLSPAGPHTISIVVLAKLTGDVKTDVGDAPQIGAAVVEAPVTATALAAVTIFERQHRYLIAQETPVF